MPTVHRLNSSPTDTSPRTIPRLTLSRRTLPRHTFPRMDISPNGRFPNRTLPRPDIYRFYSPFFTKKASLRNAEIWKYVMVGEMSVRVNVLVGKCQVGPVSFGELSVRENVRRGSVHRGTVSRGFLLGELSVWEVSGQETVLQSQNLSFTWYKRFSRYLYSLFSERSLVKVKQRTKRQ